VIGWDRIKSGPDGTFTVTCRQYTGSVPSGTTTNAPYGYALSAVRLSEYLRPQAPIITAVRRNGGALTFRFLTESDRLYSVEFKPDFEGSSWQTLTNIAGTGGSAMVTDALSSAPERFYRVRAE
jgi:hypothetical protein